MRDVRRAWKWGIACLFGLAHVAGVFGLTTQALAWVLPATGITACFNDTTVIACPKPGEDYYGQDGNYRHGAALSCQKGGDGTVTDVNTGLMWQEPMTGTSRTLAEAGAYCDALSLGGHADWRLPTLAETLTLVDAAHARPAIDTAAFPSSVSAPWWTATAAVYSVGYQWRAMMCVGYSLALAPDGTARVRCVRGGTVPAAAITVGGGGTLIDTTNDLVWEGTESAARMTWKQALAYCEARTTAGHTDWRLPNIREWQALADYSRYGPATDPRFWTAGQGSSSWSGSTYAEDPGYAWYFTGYSGQTHMRLKVDTLAVRCVRDRGPGDAVAVGALMELLIAP